MTYAHGFNVETVLVHRQKVGNYLPVCQHDVTGVPYGRGEDLFDLKN